MVKEVGVAAVPGSSFFGDPMAGRDIIRFTFCKKESTLAAAEERLTRLTNLLPGAESKSRVGI
jgi:aminotransferase